MNRRENFSQGKKRKMEKWRKNNNRSHDGLRMWPKDSEHFDALLNFYFLPCFLKFRFT